MQEMKFDENYEMPLSLSEPNTDIILVISDDLDTAYEPLSEDYQNRIQLFLGQSKVWFSKVEEKIRAEFPQEVEFKLTRVYILSEASEIDLVFGLSFWISEDIEHGRGAKISMNELQIIEYGLAEVAFC